MSKERERVTMIVVEALNNALSEFGQETNANSESIIYGDGSMIDSMALVSMICDIEEHFEEEFGYVISLTNERAMSRADSPFGTVPAMASYILELYEGADLAK